MVHELCPSLFEQDGADIWFEEEFKRKLLGEYLTLIRLEVSSDLDEIGINQVALARLSYAHVRVTLPEARKLLQVTLKNHLFEEELTWSILPSLVERLEHGIPPNSTDGVGEPRRRPRKRARKRPRAVGLVEIINAAWFHKIVANASEGGATPLGISPLGPGEAIRRRRNRLTLKAIEYSYVQREFDAWRRTPVEALPEPTEVAKERVLAEGVLTSPELIVAMKRPELSRRLIITPLLDPTETVRDAAVDVRLGTEFVVLKRQMMPNLNISESGDLLRGVERYQQRFVRRIREEIVLHPGQLIIGSTFEYIQVPPGLMCYVIGKSTWGRTGLIIATATKIDPGFKGCVTLEIINNGEVPLVLVPGVPIAQLVFHRTEANTVYRGVYSCPVGPEFPRFDAIVKGAEFWLPIKPKGRRRLPKPGLG